MDITTATALVVADQRESYPDMTEAEAIEHARNTIGLDDLYTAEELCEGHETTRGAIGDTYQCDGKCSREYTLNEAYKLVLA